MAHNFKIKTGTQDIYSKDRNIIEPIGTRTIYKVTEVCSYLSDSTIAQGQWEEYDEVLGTYRTLSGAEKKIESLKRIHGVA